MMLDHFVTEEYIDQVLPLLDQVRHEGYYVKMGVAWAISVCYVKYPEKTMEYLKKSALDDFTYNKSLQKILESYRVDQASKAIIRGMKRKLQKQ
jgi:3-methyladenine DNA glycosylase AlkD